MQFFTRIVMLVSIILANFSPTLVAFGEEVSPFQELNNKIVIDYSYYDIHTMPPVPTDTIDVTDHLGLAVKFKELEGVEIKGGDTLTLTLPSTISDEGMAKLTAMENNLPVKDENGLVIGHITASDTSIVLTFDDNVNELQHIQGSFKLKLSAINTMGLSESNAANATSVTGALGTGLPPKTVTITRPETGEGTDIFYYKTGTADRDHHKPTWYLVVNPAKKSYSESIKIVDKVGEGHHLLKDSFEITANGADNGYSHYTLDELRAKGIGDITFDGNSFEVIINSPYIDKTGFDVTYKTKVTDASLAKFGNESVAYYKGADGVEEPAPEGDIKNFELDNLIGEAEGQGDKDYVIELLKLDAADETKVLSGAMFTIYDSKNNLVDTVVTDEFGKTNTTKLLPGEYTIIERQAPPGYILDETPHKLSVFEGEEGMIGHLASLTIKNEAEKEAPLGQLVITKVSSDDTTKTLSGAVFNLLDSDKQVVKEKLVTNDEGQLKVTDLALGEYYLEEVEAPEGYEQLKEPIKVDVKENKETAHTTEVTVENQPVAVPAPLGQLVITKVSSDDTTKTLSGAVFNLLDSDKQVVKEKLVTNDEGQVKVSDLALGEYYLEEVEAPEGYELLKEPIKVDVKENKETAHTTEVIVENQPVEVPAPLGQLVITKVSSEETTKTLSGAVFNLLDSDKQVVKEKLVTNDEGQLKVSDLALGEYYLEEVEAPEGYEQLKEPIKVDVKENKETEYTTEVTVENQPVKVPAPLGQLVITKVSSDDTTKTLSGAVFNLLDSDKQVVKEKLVTNDEGQLKVSDLALGEYYLEEVEAPEGYELLKEPIKVDVKENKETEHTTEVTVENQPVAVPAPLGQLVITKVSSEETTKTLSGAVFNLLDSDKQVVKEKLVTNDEGQLKVSDLALGEYYLEEVEAPEGYELLKEPIKVDVKENKETEHTTEVTVENQPVKVPAPLGQLVITKVSSEETTKTLSGAIFNLLDSDKQVVKEKLVTNDEGQLKVTDLAFGEYYLEEVEAPEGYELLKEPIKVDVKENKETEHTTEVTVENQPVKVPAPLGQLVITKVSSEETTKTLSGAVFNLLDSDKQVVKEKLVTNDEGQLKVSDLALGEYYLEEVEAPEGYELLKEPIKVDVKENKETAHTTEVTVENQPVKVPAPLGQLVITKVSSEETTKTLSGAVFNLLDSDKQVVKEKLVTNDEGQLKVTDLAFGEYYLEEVEAPEGYELLKEPIKVDVKENKETEHTTEVTVENQPVEPETPEKPEEPETPEKPEEPETPEKPEEPETPEKPEEPETPEKPEEPETPEKPEEPGTPEKPEEPGTPEKPEEPETPEKPGEPETPEKPEEPGTPEKPEEPETPEKPGEPETPEKPGEPGTPEKPEEPGTPEKPGEPGTPEKPGKPGTPEKPEEPETPEKPEEPETPETPETSETSKNLRPTKKTEVSTNEQRTLRPILKESSNEPSKRIKLSSKETGSSSKYLPQTGEVTSDILKLTGIALLMCTSYLVVKRRK